MSGSTWSRRRAAVKLSRVPETYTAWHSISHNRHMYAVILSTSDQVIEAVNVDRPLLSDHSLIVVSVDLYTSHQSTPSVGMLAITRRRCVCRGSATVDTGAGAAVRRWRPVPVLQRNSGRWWTLTCHCEWSAAVQVVTQHVGTMQNVSWRRRRVGDLSGCTGTRRPQRRDHGDGGSSVVRGKCYNKKLLRSRRLRYRPATTIQGPCGRRSTHNWRRHHLDHPATCQATTLQLSSVRNWTRSVLRRPLSSRQCSTHTRRRVVCHCSSQWRPMKCAAYSERFRPSTVLLTLYRLG